MTEILTENHRSEKRWSKLFFDRIFRSKYILTEILTENVGENIILTDILTEFSVKILDFDRNFYQQFGQNIILTENSVKIGQNSGDKI